MNAEIYQQHVLDHYSNPRNRREIENAELQYRDSNPLCGDEVAMYAKLKDGLMEDLSFIGRGCAISQASASMITEALKGASLSQAAEMGKDEVIKMLMIQISPTRLKCALLPLKTLQAGIRVYQNGAARN